MPDVWNTMALKSGSPAWDFRRYQPDAVMVCLGQNGCLRVLPGSHVRHTALHDRLDAPHSAGLGAATDTDRVEFSDWPGEADVCVVAGDLLIGDARLLHAAHDNKTGERRTLITLWYQPEFDAMPERMQAQMAAKAQPIPGEWPEAAQSLLRPLWPYYQGAATPYERTLYRAPAADGSETR